MLGERLSILVFFFSKYACQTLYNGNLMKHQGAFVKQYAPGGNKVQKASFSFKVKVKVTRSLTLVSFERASLVEYEVSISYGSKVKSKVKVDNRQTNKQTG